MNKDELTQTFIHHIGPQEVDCSGYMSLTALGSAILNTAGDAAEKHNFGMNFLLKEGLTWVVSRLSISIDKLPKMYDVIKIETWIKNYGRVFTIRNFKIYNSKREEICKASSQWAVIDLKTRRPFDLRNKPEWQQYATEESRGVEDPIGISAISGELISEHRVRFSDIDFNQHTNSMKYAEWMLDSYSPDTLKNRSITQFDINYMHEALYGQNIKIVRSENENKSLFNLTDNDNFSVCRAAIRWRL